MVFKDIIIGRSSVWSSGAGDHVHALVLLDSLQKFEDENRKRAGGHFNSYEVIAISQDRSYYYLPGFNFHTYTPNTRMRNRYYVSDDIIDNGVEVPFNNLPLYLSWPDKSDLFDKCLKGEYDATNNY